MFHKTTFGGLCKERVREYLLAHVGEDHTGRSDVLAFYELKRRGIRPSGPIGWLAGNAKRLSVGVPTRGTDPFVWLLWPSRFTCSGL